MTLLFRAIWWTLRSLATRRDLLEPASNVDPISEDSEVSCEPDQGSWGKSYAHPNHLLNQRCAHRLIPKLLRHRCLIITPLSRSKIGQPQNVPPGSTPLQLFQLFFAVKDIAVSIEQSNPRAIRKGFRPLTVGEFYRYIGCPVYITFTNTLRLGITGSAM